MPERKRIRHLLAHGPIVVDGHNVCYADPALKRAMLRDPEAARAALEARIRHPHRLRLIYDGGPGGRFHRLRRGGLQVIYSGRESADDVLIQELARLPSPLLVISDDRSLCARARNRGARCAGSAVFLRWLDRPGTPIHRAPDPLPDPTEVRFWVEAFGGEEKNA